MPGPALVTLISPDGTAFRDLDHDGVMAPFEDPRLSPAERVEDLLPRLSMDDKVGLLFQTVIESGPEGTLLQGPGHIATLGTPELVLERRITHANVHGLGTARESARWSNALQELAASADIGIPVTVSTDPRHGFAENAGAAFAADSFSAWPEPLGLAALGDAERIAEFADIARREYVAVGIRAALHPQIDLATEPRWGRQFHTFGNDVDQVVDYTRAYLAGFQGDSLGPTSVACMAKHFPGGGAQLDGEDAHFPYGREQVYPGGRFAEHLRPFEAAIEAGVSAMMPYYGMPVGLSLGDQEMEAVGFGFNRAIVTDLLRERLGYVGVVCTDWSLITDTWVAGKVLPARAWGAEYLDRAPRMVKILDAGVDQFGGEECTDLLLDLVREGRVSEERIDESARRLLLVKFQLGLFDDPFVDEDAAEEVVGCEEFRAAGRRAQAESLVLLQNDLLIDRPLLPLTEDPSRRVYVEGLDPQVAARLGTVVDDPADADLAVVRLPAPFEPRDDLFLESYFHQGSLDYRPGLVARLAMIAGHCPLVIDANLERPAILTPLVAASTALVASFGASGDALVDVLTGEVAPRGRLPFEVPSSMDAVRASQEDVANDTADPAFGFGAGLSY